MKTLNKPNKSNETELIKQTTQLIDNYWNELLSEDNVYYASSLGNELATRKIIKNFIEFYEQGKIIPVSDSTEPVLCLMEMVRILEDVLNVDMHIPGNRKGELPKTMRLAKRSTPENIIRDKVIHRVFDFLRYGSGIPGRSYEDCSDIFLRALEQSDKRGGVEDGGLTPENINKIYQRMRER